MVKKWKVYGLLDENNVVFYIGCTSQNIKYRLSRHVYDSVHCLGANKEKENIIRNVLSNGCKLNYQIIFDNLDRQTGRKIERKLILENKELTNKIHSDNYKLSDEHKQKIKKSVKEGYTAEHRRVISKLNCKRKRKRNKPMSEEVRLKLSKANIGRIYINDGKIRKRVYHYELPNYKDWHLGCKLFVK